MQSHTVVYTKIQPASFGISGMTQYPCALVCEYCAYLQAGIEVVDEATEDDLLTDVDKLAELGVKNKKHLKKLAKLKKEAKKKQKKQARAARKDHAKDDL